MKRVENKIVKVVLTVMGETDVLVFLLDENDSEKYVIDLNDSSCQIKIKDVFSKLLEELIEFDINLDLEIQEGYSKNFYDEIISFMRNFFSGAFKDNKNLSYGFLTGILL